MTQSPTPPDNGAKLDALLSKMDTFTERSNDLTTNAPQVMDIYARLGHLVIGATAGTAMVGAAIWSLVQFFTRLIGGEL